MRVELTAKRFLRIWWAFQWRTWALFLVLACPWFCYALTHPDFNDEWGETAELPLVLWLALSGVAGLYLAMRKAYADFRVALLPHSVKL